jgi:hypothetical protein
MRDTGTAVFLVHHRRKQPRKADEGAGPLESANLRRWFEDCRGSSSLINGSDIRLGVDEPVIGAVGKDEAAIVMRGFGRLRGDVGPIYVTRDTDDDGQVLECADYSIAYVYRQVAAPSTRLRFARAALYGLEPTLPSPWAFDERLDTTK